jgi:hypothetical protein
MSSTHRSGVITRQTACWSSPPPYNPAWARISDGLAPMASAMRSRLSAVTLRSPRSILPMCDRSISARWASASCEVPCSLRAARIAIPSALRRARSASDLGLLDTWAPSQPVHPQATAYTTIFVLEASCSFAHAANEQGAVTLNSWEQFKRAIVFGAGLVACWAANINGAHAQGTSQIDEYTNNTTAGQYGPDLCRIAGTRAAEQYARSIARGDLLPKMHRLVGSRQTPGKLPVEAFAAQLAGSDVAPNSQPKVACVTSATIDGVMKVTVTFSVSHWSNAQGEAKLQVFEVKGPSGTIARADQRRADYSVVLANGETVSYQQALELYAARLAEVAQQKQAEAEQLASHASSMAVIAQQEQENGRLAREQAARQSQLQAVMQRKLQDAMASLKKLPCEVRGGTWGMTPEEWAVVDVPFNNVLNGTASMQEFDAALLIYGPKCRFLIGQ